MLTSVPPSKFVVVRDQSEAPVEAGPIWLIAVWAVAMLLIGAIGNNSDAIGAIDSFQLLGNF